MTNEDFKFWRKSLGLTQQKAAEALGLSKTTIETYESGIRRDNHQPSQIPYAIGLAMAAISAGIGPWSRE